MQLSELLTQSKPDSSSTTRGPHLSSERTTPLIRPAANATARAIPPNVWDATPYVTESGVIPVAVWERYSVKAKEQLGMLPTEPAQRKQVPIATGFVDYFPLAIAAVAALSRAGNEQHNPGKPLHWDRSKSGDEGDALMRHFLERGTLDIDGIRHSAKVAWRAMALLQKELESVEAL